MLIDPAYAQLIGKMSRQDFDILLRHESTLRARIGELEAENARLKGDAEGQTVEGGDDQTQMTIERFCEEARDKTGGPTPELRRVYQAYLDSQKWKDTPQPEHDRTVRLAALEEAAKIADSTGSFWRGHPNGAHARAIAKAIRSLIDQTGGEGGI